MATIEDLINFSKKLYWSGFVFDCTLNIAVIIIAVFVSNVYWPAILTIEIIFLFSLAAQICYESLADEIVPKFNYQVGYYVSSAVLTTTLGGLWIVVLRQIAPTHNVELIVLVMVGVILVNLACVGETIKLRSWYPEYEH